MKVKSIEETGLFGSGEKKMRRHSVSNTYFSSAAKDSRLLVRE